PDIITTDMLPRDESVIKTSAGEDAYEVYKYKLKFGYHYQVARNCLQLNRYITDSLLTFSDVAPLAGVEATDWSWSPLMADFDNDGLKDLFVSNGIVRRPNDLDYINFISNQAIQDSLQTIESSDLNILNTMPDGKVSNFVFKNVDGIHFKDVSTEWGVNTPSFSNGSAYADLDNDGDLDVVVNNINQPAFVYQNNTRSQSIRISLIGSKPNSFGIGAKVLTYTGTDFQSCEVSATRGFSSSSDTRIIVGLGNSVKADSILIVWPKGTFQKLNSVEAGKTISAKQSDAKERFDYQRLLPSKRMVEPLPKSSVPNFVHQEDDYNSFNNEGLIPHMLTTQGPPLAQGDVDGDALTDIFVGGGKDQSASIFIQTKQGGWIEKRNKDFFSDSFTEDIAAEFIDVDGDHDLDLLVAAGG
ncbi:MAG: FG-GAP-like repeat-containing protein, partial [bacterium]